ncbi:hypothetical protein L9W92_17935 [Pelotomaculum terephthalicicum JT]|uniref:hypothetical protein n=1 Tax=Pelotomaculum TaxID=191373 RepID=UPI0009C7D42F|nr:MULTISPECIES: hypothetical protein [Pelotomaculum]MCG9969880.1 hypothetical protein [Pelotomaculum terephthalicicum JT]OPX87260.1 MAG: hypothetical protein A4E54_01756 [Pelotomaculum sp. PtaB.Bin117]OPY60369.1 MAG: hypothetical protein A4E56_02735 [Pelotomaculum sp. PtaU1.Bin065]
MKFRIDGLSLFSSSYYDTLEEATKIIFDKKGRKGSITVEMTEKEYITLINSYETQIDKNIAIINTLQQENQKQKKQIEILQNSLVHPEVVENIKQQARQQINGEIEAREKITEELTKQIEVLTRREEGLRDALGRWRKKAIGEDLRPPKDLKQKGFQYRVVKNRIVKMYFLEKYLPHPFDTGFNELEGYALLELAKGVNLKKIYLDRGKWVAQYESLNPLG